jgi:hypothetical protein
MSLSQMGITNNKPAFAIGEGQMIEFYILFAFLNSFKNQSVAE